VTLILDLDVDDLNMYLLPKMKFEDKAFRIYSPNKTDTQTKTDVTERFTRPQLPVVNKR